MYDLYIVECISLFPHYTLGIHIFISKETKLDVTINNSNHEAEIGNKANFIFKRIDKWRQCPTFTVIMLHLLPLHDNGSIPMMICHN